MQFHPMPLCSSDGLIAAPPCPIFEQTGDRTEIYLNYYDIMVKHAFNNYRDILAEASYSPLMAEHLSYLASKSHAYVYDTENKRISRADENFAR